MKKWFEVHNILVSVGDGYDDAFDIFLEEHKVAVEPSGVGIADEAESEGKRFAEFLAEFCDPDFLHGLTVNLPDYL